MSKQTFYITTPIYYVNGSPHLGHAYTSTAADALARWNRLEGHDVFFLTGTDEHGQKVEAAARAAGIDPQEFTDRVSADFQDMARVMNISNDDFIRTTEPRHKASAQALWKKLQESGAIYLGKYEGWYAVRDEAFYDEDETTVKPDGTRVAIPPAPRWNGWWSPAISSSSAPSRTGFSPITRKTRASSPRRPSATRSSASCAPGCTTSRSAAPPSPGASRCRAMRRM